MLHPNKNKSVDVEGAFKLIGKAWGTLSDFCAGKQALKSPTSPSHASEIG